MAYQPIEHYGVIGDLHTVALVGMHGSIDWLCLPHIDSPSVFGAILDDQQGGRWRIAPTTECTTKQFYWPETNILVTRFLAPDGVAEVIDFMPIATSPPPKRNTRSCGASTWCVVRCSLLWSACPPSTTRATLIAWRLGQTAQAFTPPRSAWTSQPRFRCINSPCTRCSAMLLSKRRRRMIGVARARRRK